MIATETYTPLVNGPTVFNATSNFVANASSVLGVDPIARVADYIVRAAAGHAKMK